ncbi:hypothetical protein QJS04_geneDACA024237 [Acorus gramineus]|uniref:RecQ mediated genome instability protein 1 OB-fold domain-containing protein n=1 Tax=Acorus gramineus TaxID=55184 RepID=A0AAV9AML3_ACOGR|nr:hypothetical protein QJS04_geneDACA024237 [Acorus gramineus]
MTILSSVAHQQWSPPLPTPSRRPPKPPKPISPHPHLLSPPPLLLSLTTQPKNRVLAVRSSSPAVVSSVDNLFDFICEGPLAGKLGLTPEKVAENLDEWLVCGSRLCGLFGMQELQMSPAEKARIYHYYIPVFMWCEDQIERHRKGFGDGEEVPPLVAKLRSQNPGNVLLELRGNAGSHDLQFSVDTLTGLTYGGKGDRADPSTWPEVKGPLTVILFEGWMLGFIPLPTESVKAVDPQLEVVNKNLEAYYDAWDKYVESWIIIKIKDPNCVFKWRLQAEVAMRADGKPGMSDEEVLDFVSRYLPAYKAYLPALDDEAIRLRLRTSSSSTTSVSAAERLLLDLDLRSFGGKSLPDPSSVKKSSHLIGPKVVSVRDVCKSGVEEASFAKHDRRLLRFVLTDGVSEVVAVERTTIPSIAEEIVPGTKVRLENKIAVYNGILCLNPKVVTVLGGVVQSLYEEWEMSRKYSSFSRSSLRSSNNNDGLRPPPFEKLQIGAQQSQAAQTYDLRISNPHSLDSEAKAEKSDDRRGGKYQTHPTMVKDQRLVSEEADGAHKNSRMAPSTGRIDDKPSSSESRPKEVIEAIPVQNQAAAQKLLQKLSQQTPDYRHSRGPRHIRGRGKQEEDDVFTLEEWESRKGAMKQMIGHGSHDISRDEELARQLQNQLDLEDAHLRSGQDDEAERIRMSMFSFGKEADRGESYSGMASVHW